MSTSPVIVPVHQDALDTKADAAFSCPDLQSFVDLTDLNDPVAHTNPYATFEQDYWLLDGTYQFMPAGAHVGLMSGSMSASNTNFAAPVVLTITFASTHSTVDGLTLYFSAFSGDWIDSLSIQYLDASNAQIRLDNYTPTSATLSTNQAVSNFKKIIISMSSTNKAYRCARLTGIDFDSLTTFAGSDIKSAQVIEEISPLAVELPINVLEFTLYSADGNFSITDPGGIFVNWQYKEPLDVYEETDSNLIYMGRFYLDKRESISENLAQFRAIDAIGLMEQIDYLGGMWYAGGGIITPTPINSEDLIAEIMTAAGIDYTLDASLTGVTVYGWAPIASCREALQQVCFRLGAYATCARSDKVQIRPMELASDLSIYDHTITATQKALGQPVAMRPLVTGVTVRSHQYEHTGATPTEIYFDQDMAAGSYTLYFNKPGFGAWNSVYLDTVNHPEYVTSYDNNWLAITLPAGGRLLVEDSGFTEGLAVHRVDGSFPAGTNSNIVTIDDATLVHAALGQTVAQRVYDYYAQRYVQKTKLFGYAIAVGDSVLIATQSGKQIKGIVEKNTINLSGGFISQLEIVGVIA